MSLPLIHLSFNTLSRNNGYYHLTLLVDVVGLIDRHIRELTCEVNFRLGAQLLAGYESYRLSLGFWRLSNAGQMSNSCRTNNPSSNSS